MVIKSKNVGQVLMSAGVICGIVYILINLYAFSNSYLKFTGALLYVSIVALLSGLVFYLLARVSRA
jgi:hypothetical protein